MNDPRWLPLESNPESFNRWSKSLGSSPSPSLSISYSSVSHIGLRTEGEGAYTFQDVFGLEPECLEWVKQPVKAVLMLFPVTEGYEKMRKEQDEDVLENGVEGVADVIYFKQTSPSFSPFFFLPFKDLTVLFTVANACGTFALLHTLANVDVPISSSPSLTDRSPPLPHIATPPLPFSFSNMILMY